MLDNMQHVLSEALKLPETQRFQLIDALLDQSDKEPEKFREDAPPLSNERLQELVKEGKEAIAQGNAKAHPTPRALANRVGEIFDEAICANTKADSQE